MKTKLLKDNRGFTIVEVIASVFIFSVIVSVTGGIFVRSLVIERRSFAAQKIQENSLRAFEMMAREIRISRMPDTDSACLAQSISLTRPGVGAINYSLISGQIYRDENGTGAVAITSDSIIFEKLNFCINGSMVTDRQPTRITILAQISSRGDVEATKYNIQTTVTSRDLSDDLQY